MTNAPAITAAITPVIAAFEQLGTSLDFVYLRRWATDLNVVDLLERAYEDAGLNGLAGV